ncbi:A24 family peptidase [Cellulomonas sp. RIT-PI-Y]|uniref:prepilin peptidase n=1 Tax=Cellulomonas sp. RIT-PI-Y TaxID=3035297 RepID=UPI0021DA5E58|nr:A24 family peptidase [Cellulomonas sp. RIT-PI-Y]
MSPQLALVVGAVVIGLAIGSFLNVVVHRVPRSESVVPRSACPRCGRPIRGRDNIPVLSWLLLRGRCRDCRAPISRRYPLVEAGTGVCFGLVAWWTGASWLLPALLFLVAVSIALALIDLDVHRLPDVIVLPAVGVGLLLLALASWSPGDASDWGALVRAVLGGLALFTCYLVLALIHPGGMGFGDVKLAGLLGLYLAWFGWPTLAVGAFAAFLAGGGWATGLLLTRRARKGSGIPFGPWMLLGAWVGIVAGRAVWSGYLGLVGL